MKEAGKSERKTEIWDVWKNPYTDTSKKAARALWTHAWDQLTRANQDKRHPFRTPVLSTVASNGSPRARTLVLRRANRQDGTLLLYTDLRSQKVSDWSATSSVHWLFWHPKKQLQVGASGSIERIEPEEEDRLFDQLPKYGRKAYATVQAPGHANPDTPDGLPENWAERELDETEYARQNFAIYRTTLLRADLLRLGREEGHRRLHAHREGPTAEWQLQWITP